MRFLVFLVTVLPGLLLLAAACGGSEPAEQETAQDAAGFDPDAAELERLVFWGPLDGFVHYLSVPPSLQALFEQLLGSDSPAADKYLIELAAFPSPYWDQVVGHLMERFDAPHRSVYEFPQLWNFHEEDAATPSYLRFKQALYAGQLPEMAAFVNPAAAMTIDAREVVWGGVGVDGIPPLESPRQVRAAEAADWINGSDLVVGAEVNGDARAYPIRIIAWHEMVNDTIGGVPVSLAYCTLCGSAILYDGRIGGEVYRLGTSGLLYRSNKLMYDRSTNTLWNQFSGRPAWGPLVGEDIRLAVIPTVLTTWSAWLDAHPDSTVLDIQTGHIRDYGPGAAYREYNESADTWFHVPVVDDRVAQKADVLVVRVGSALTAYPIAALAERGVIVDEIGGVAVVVVATADGESGRAYESGGVELQSADLDADTVTDADGGVWTITEAGLISQAGEVLARLSSHNAFWFAVPNQTEGGALWEG